MIKYSIILTNTYVFGLRKTWLLTHFSIYKHTCSKCPHCCKSGCLNRNPSVCVTLVIVNMWSAVCSCNFSQFDIVCFFVFFNFTSVKALVDDVMSLKFNLVHSCSMEEQCTSCELPNRSNSSSLLVKTMRRRIRISAIHLFLCVMVYL